MLKMKYDDIMRNNTEYKINSVTLNFYESVEMAGNF